MKHRLSICDSAFAHAKCSAAPYGDWEPQHVEWDRTAPYDHRTIYTDARIMEAPPESIIWLIEPRHNNEELYMKVLAGARSFREVWTCDKKFIKQLAMMGGKGRLVPFGGCWIFPKDREIWPKANDKSREVSIIAGLKRGTPAYDLRHAVIAANTDKLQAFGTEYEDIGKDKILGMGYFRFHVAIENGRCDYYFTEKLIDCFATGTVPIYCGCPNIDEIFNRDGMIIANSLENIGHAIDLCSPELYESMMPAILDNHERAKSYFLAEDWLHEHAHSLIEELTIEPV